MPKIKTRDVVKGTIKKIDKAAIAADRMRSAYVQTKEKAEHATHPEEHSAEEYASDRIKGGVDRMTHEAAHQFDKQGRKGLAETKRNVFKAKDSIRQFKKKRAAESLKRQFVRASGNKTIKAVDRQAIRPFCREENRQDSRQRHDESGAEIGQDHKDRH